MALHVILDTVDPSAAPPSEGVHWVNTNDGKQFLSVGVGAVEDWIDVTTATAAQTAQEAAVSRKLENPKGAQVGELIIQLDSWHNEAAFSASRNGGVTFDAVKKGPNQVLASPLGLGSPTLVGYTGPTPGEAMAFWDTATN